jgi:hypothetical protein
MEPTLYVSKTGLVALLVLAFASQLTFAGATNRAGNRPLSSRSSDRVVVLPELQVGIGLTFVAPVAHATQGQ